MPVSSPGGLPPGVELRPWQPTPGDLRQPELRPWGAPQPSTPSVPPVDPNRPGLRPGLGGVPVPDGMLLPETGPNAQDIRLRNEQVRKMYSYGAYVPWLVGPWGWFYSSNGFLGTSWWCWDGWYRPTIYGFDANRFPTQFPDRTAARATTSTPRPAEPKTDAERGDLAVAAGDMTKAIKAYTVHLGSFPRDSQARRALGVALIASGRTREGASVVLEAYRRTPDLARTPYRADLLEDGRLHEAIQRAAQEGRRSGSASAWLSAAVLSQTDNRPAAARRMIERAQECGLDSSISSALLGALERQTPVGVGAGVR